MSEISPQAGERLNALLLEAGLKPLAPETSNRFEQLLSLFIRWNTRLNLSSVRDEAGILSRHLVESIACAQALPAGITTLLDFGSGGGLPGIPIAVCRPEIAVTLAESNGRKAAFLREAERVLGLSVRVHAGRAEVLRTAFECVTLRAVDRMAEAVAAAIPLVSINGWLALMTTSADLHKLQGAAGPGFRWADPVALRGSEQRLLALAQKLSSPT